ncbi:replication protein A 70 kDa DNA-binding subunit B-like [Senna tora]|uniref:Replication protein A 70 kDa DNA-binding subunit B-like n=1 Tax=Senna tora TaxID=362788 RepID=A0A834T5Y6_9FABA|nr:replication protein A 70 kDa DNA-binding subunit B-like [Senna tora]
MMMVPYINTVLAVNRDRGWYYDACKKYAKKLEPGDTIFFCNKCTGLVNTSTTRFKIELMVMDDSGNANFYRDVTSFIRMTAIELRKVKRISSDSSIMDKFTWFRHAKIDLSSVVDELSTPVKPRSAQITGLDGRRLSFLDAIDSPITSTPSNGKRSASDDSYESFSSFEQSMDLPIKKIKLENK